MVILQASGRGWLAGLKVDVQNRAWWLRPPLADIILPRGFGLGLLEGWETIIVDGDTTEPLVGAGGEDYFSGGFYFAGAPFYTAGHGCTVRSFLLGRVSAYRFHLDDPIFFERSIEITMDHGLRNLARGDYSSVAYWYQDEPHAPFPTIPPLSQRLPRTPWQSPVQWLICAIVGFALVGFVAYIAAM